MYILDINSFTNDLWGTCGPKRVYNIRASAEFTKLTSQWRDVPRENAVVIFNQTGVLLRKRCETLSKNYFFLIFLWKFWENNLFIDNPNQNYVFIIMISGNKYFIE